MKRVFIIHGWSGHPNEHWLPWLKEKLQEKGFKVEVPDMHDTDNPIIENWVGHLERLVGVPDSETYFIGHSIGCQTILRYLEKVNSQVGGAVFAAGWFDLENMESEEEEKIADPWIKIPIDIDKIKKVLPKSTLIISDNDPYDAFEFNKQKFSEIGSKIIVLHNSGHITSEDGYNELPEVLVEIEEMTKNENKK